MGCFSISSCNEGVILSVVFFLLINSFPTVFAFFKFVILMVILLLCLVSTHVPVPGEEDV